MVYPLPTNGTPAALTVISVREMVHRIEDAHDFVIENRHIVGQICDVEDAVCNMLNVEGRLWNHAPVWLEGALCVSLR